MYRLQTSGQRGEPTLKSSTKSLAARKLKRELHNLHEETQGRLNLFISSKRLSGKAMANTIFCVCAGKTVAVLGLERRLHTKALAALQRTRV